ncbi:hypothetical protein DMH15_22485 [Streptomyces sp. WAC 06725]|uniref:amino acid kinase family protein n=1 Tax=Streptomyces sp. WAC 06725 TaxID=2203209 RepID=UPI000F73DF72|nr:hypothetical protein [Streptomyces sp. WAC 06725]RSO32837.1 hypothetical protein DMH15_22485 [Streptomyces sp. WAC 06725]
MALVVQEYEDLSLRDVEDVERLAKRVVTARQDGHRLIVVTPPDMPPALRGQTVGTGLDEALTALGGEVYAPPLARLSTLFAADRAPFGLAGVLRPVREALARGAIVRISRPRGDQADTVAHPARAGTHAIRLAAAFKADICEVYTSAGGFHTADPGLVPLARPVRTVGYETACELAACGAGTLTPRDIEIARQHGLTVRLRPSDTTTACTDPDIGDGTLICAERRQTCGEQCAPAGITHDLPGIKVVLAGPPNSAPITAQMIRALADTRAGLLLAACGSRPAPAPDQPSNTTLFLTGPTAYIALATLEDKCTSLGVRILPSPKPVGRISLIGSGMRSRTKNVPLFCASLAAAEVTLEMVTATESRISALCPAACLPRAVRALHTAFSLDRGPQPG